MVVFYTDSCIILHCQLAAFLTVERMITPIENVEDLATQSKIAYGTLESGSTMTFFRDSQIETYQKMWRFMENRPSAFVKTYDEGVQRVIEGNYAFLMESTMLDFKVQRNCNLTQIGGLLDSKGYGIATPIGSPWRDKISLAILHLQEKGIIRMLYDRWWKRPGITCSRDDKSKESKANALGVENIGGVFVVLLGGLAVAIVTAFIEFCINSRKNAHNLRQSLCAEMSDELKIAVKCHGEGRQRPALKRKCSKCVGGMATPGSGNCPGIEHDHKHHHQTGPSHQHHHSVSHQTQHHQECRDSNCSGCLIRMSDTYSKNDCKCDTSVGNTGPGGGVGVGSGVGGAYVPDDALAAELYTKRSDTPNQNKLGDLISEAHSRYDNYYNSSSKTNLIHRRSSPSSALKNSVGGTLNSSTNCIWSVTSNRPENSPPSSPLPPPPPPPAASSILSKQAHLLNGPNPDDGPEVDDEDDEDNGMCSVDEQDGQLVIECDQDMDDLYFASQPSTGPIMMMMLNGAGREETRVPSRINSGAGNTGLNGRSVMSNGSDFCHRSRTPNVIHQYLPVNDKKIGLESHSTGSSSGVVPNTGNVSANIVTVHPINGGVLMLDKSGGIINNSSNNKSTLAFNSNYSMPPDNSIVDSELMAFTTN